MSDTEQKWNRIYSQRSVEGVDACWTLDTYSYLLPKTGQALDLASGMGGNALFLASKGLDVQAWDISQHAVDSLNQHAISNSINLRAIKRDVEMFPPEPRSFDVIVISNFLHRESLADLSLALKPQGIIVYQTHVLARPDGMSGPSNPAFLLEPNELLEAFSQLRILAFHDEALQGDLSKGHRGFSALVAMNA